MLRDFILVSAALMRCNGERFYIGLTLRVAAVPVCIRLVDVLARACTGVNRLLSWCTCAWMGLVAAICVVVCMCAMAVAVRDLSEILPRCRGVYDTFLAFGLYCVGFCLCVARNGCKDGMYFIGVVANTEFVWSPIGGLGCGVCGGGGQQTVELVRWCSGSGRALRSAAASPLTVLRCEAAVQCGSHSSALIVRYLC